MKKIIYLLLIVLFAIPVFAKKVDVETAKFAAKNLYYSRINQFKDVNLSNITLTLSYTEVVNNEPVYYAFNVNENEGFVIISADDIVRPCIGYSFEGPFVITNQPPSFKFFMRGFRDQIADAVSNKATASTQATQEWANLLTANPVIIKSKSIQPLLIHTWNQDWPYNELCPVDAAGPGGHVYVGCVATSMAQVMKYYNYPDVGIGSHTDPSYLNGGYGTLTVNYAAQTYAWENMTNTINGSNLEIAKLGYHCSIAVNMNYSATGSGAQTSSIPGALESHYNYSTDCQYVQRSSYTTTSWENLLMDQIDNRWPMVYSGTDPSEGGHAWVCDGYQAGTPNTFHMNWGWGGYANAYFDVDNLASGNGTFSESHAAVINIYPPAANYPEGCSSTAKIITGEAGTFNDGSGNQNYPDNKDCLYLIQPACASVVSLVFDRFDLGTGDNVYIYGGTSTSAPLLATFNSTTVPSTTVTSTAGAMLIRFVTDGSSNATGWYVSYSVAPCLGSLILTDLAGTITDGSQTCDYSNSTNCRWDIAPTAGNSATIYHLTFPNFNFAAADAGDYIKIYKNTLSTGNVIGTYNASNIPPSPLDINATKVIIKFQTNTANTASGWTINYTTTITGIENNLAEFGANVYPNPFNNDATISYTLKNQTDVKITVTNILGKEIGKFEQSDVQGSHNLQLSSIANNISQGIYFVNLTFNDKSTLIKIVCTK
jgi:hypothetical protein